MIKKFLFAAIVLVFSGNYAFAANIYDAEGKIIRKTNSDGSYSEYVYNSWENVYETVYSSAGEVTAQNFYWGSSDSSPSGTFTVTSENGETIRNAQTGPNESYAVSFNAAGQQTSGTYYYNGQVDSQEICSYNGNEMTRLAYWGVSGDITDQTPGSKEVFVYNDLGAKTSQSYYNVSTDTVTSKTEWEYEDGHRVSETSYYNNTPNQKTEWGYDENGNIISAAYYYSSSNISNDTPNSKVLWGYDDNGNKTSETYYNSDLNLADRKFEWGYDEQGRMISQISYNSPESVANNTPDGKMTAVYDKATNSYYVTGYDNPEAIASGTPSEQFVYNESTGSRLFYNADGKLDSIENDSLLSDGARFTYDESGNLSGVQFKNCYVDDVR